MSSENEGAGPTSGAERVWEAHWQGGTPDRASRPPWHTDRPGDALDVLLNVRVDDKPVGAYLAESAARGSRQTTDPEQEAALYAALKAKLNDQAAQQVGDQWSDAARRAGQERTPPDDDQAEQQHIDRLRESARQLIAEAAEQDPSRQMTPGDVFMRILTLRRGRGTVMDSVLRIARDVESDRLSPLAAGYDLRDLSDYITATLAAGDRAERATRPASSPAASRPRSPHLVRGPADLTATKDPSPHEGKPNPRGGPGYSAADVKDPEQKRTEAVRANLENGARAAADQAEQQPDQGDKAEGK